MADDDANFYSEYQHLMPMIDKTKLNDWKSNSSLRQASI